MSIFRKVSTSKIDKKCDQCLHQGFQVYESYDNDFSNEINLRQTVASHAYPITKEPTLKI